ncbi:aminotransferase class IV [Jiella mangrovi]|uniref:Probable branched-chain-amino-acid aminotransferase n=1 Tax=Jiella mangrovi TaxID=2821407 RepID=A0ABS4BLP9_9HYPH|nr:aminotransferase class IV [Jiella mangrovi]MBP0617648.1 aminotransferase class IV [Jiella mangrovi]
MPQSAEVIWRDGTFRPSEGAIDANDRGLLLADGVFDTALVLNGRVFRRQDHLARLAAACSTLQIPAETALLRSAMAALAGRCGDGSIRLTVTRGPAPRGLAFPAAPKPTILGSYAPLAPALMFRPVALATAAIRRNETSPTSRVKTLSYLDAVLAAEAAKAAGADDALFLNGAGRIASTNLANLFLLQSDRLSTPALSEGVLPGITRSWIIADADAAGLRVEEREISPDIPAGAAVFATNSLRLIAPVASLDGKTLPKHPAILALATRLCEAIQAECGRDPREYGASLAALAPAD